jgi:hypothetical protein
MKVSLFAQKVKCSGKFYEFFPLVTSKVCVAGDSYFTAEYLEFWLHVSSIT